MLGNMSITSWESSSIIFTSLDWRIPTGAHHHNAIAKQNIQTIMSIPRTLMLHSAIHWSEVADACLWPMAVQLAVFLHDHMPNEQTGISPHDIFTRS
jgi:hypothetical protein